MYRIDDPSASATLPTPEAALTEGYWTEGNPGTGTPATLERASWFNMVQEELRAVAVAGGLTPSKTTYNQILTALKSMFSSVVGSMRNAKMYVVAASASATFTADEIIVETALGGQTFRLANYSQAINLATTGAGGMDTGTAPVSGYVALYAIYNPTTGTASILAKNGTSAVQTNVYSGANMPAGYTASALIGVWATNASSQFKIGLQRDRTVSIPLTIALNTAAIVAATTFSMTSVVPPNATGVGGELSASSTSASTISLAVGGDTNMIGQNICSAVVGAAGVFAVNYTVQMSAAQTIAYSTTNSAGTPTFNIYISSYTF